MKQKRNFSVLLILSSLLAFGCIENSKIDSDFCPDDENKTAPGLCGCGVADPESDQNGDGKIDISDCLDLCPDDDNKNVPGLCGCGVADPESDQNGDGKIDISDCLDLCPDNPDKVVPGLCGCDLPDPESDQNGDGKIDISDCLDLCPDNPDKLSPGACGCEVLDTDSDGDTVPDCKDQCPEDAQKLEPGLCGCGAPDTDSDGDTVPDCKDQCPEDAEKLVPGACGCGVSDTDNDGDTVPDCKDACPLNPDAIKEEECPFESNKKCTSGMSKCDGRRVLYCDGGEWMVDECPNGFTCARNEYGTSCLFKYPGGACISGTSQFANDYLGCYNNTIVACKNGILSRTPCADDEWCVNGECKKDQMCGALPSGTKYCDAGVLKQCDNGVSKIIEDCRETDKYCHMEKLECVESAFGMCTYNTYNVVDASKDSVEPRIACVNVNSSQGGEMLSCKQGSFATSEKCTVTHGSSYCLNNECVISKCDAGYHLDKDEENRVICVKDEVIKTYNSIFEILADLRPSESCADTPKKTGPVGITLTELVRTAVLTDSTGAFYQNATGGIFIESENKTPVSWPPLAYEYSDPGTYIYNDGCHLTVRRSSSASFDNDQGAFVIHTPQTIGISEDNLSPTSQYMDYLVDLEGWVTAKKYIGEEAGYDVPWGWEVETEDGLTFMVVGIVGGYNEDYIKVSMEAGLKYELKNGILTYWKGKAVFVPRNVSGIYEYCEADACVANDETMIKSCNTTTHRVTKNGCRGKMTSTTGLKKAVCKENACVAECLPGYKVDETGKRCVADKGASCAITNGDATVSVSHLNKACVGTSLYSCYNGTATETKCTTTVGNAVAACDAKTNACSFECNEGYKKTTDADGNEICKKVVCTSDVCAVSGSTATLQTCKTFELSTPVSCATRSGADANANYGCNSAKTACVIASCKTGYELSAGKCAKITTCTDTTGLVGAVGQTYKDGWYGCNVAKTAYVKCSANKLTATTCATGTVCNAETVATTKTCE